jgi:hypothetical protein
MTYMDSRSGGERQPVAACRWESGCPGPGSARGRLPGGRGRRPRQRAGLDATGTFWGVIGYYWVEVVLVLGCNIESRTESLEHE